MTTVLAGGTVLTSLLTGAMVEADVTIEGGRVAAVGPATGRGARHDCSGCLVIPGNVCAHTHLYSALARGMPFDLAPPSNFLQILQRVWWRLDRALDEESIRASALVGGMEALLSGTTTLVDHHASPNAIDGSLDVIADALEELGLRSILCYEVTDRDGPKRAAAGLDENRRFLSGGADRPLTRGMVGAHASFTLSAETLAACVEAAAGRRAGIHIHAAEDGVDERDCQARFGSRVIERLDDAGVLGPESLLAHCVSVNPAEVARIQDSGVTVAHNPRSNMNNGVGRAPLAGLGERVALGTDGIDQDMFAESRSAYWRGREDDPAFTPDRVLAMLAHGAAFIGGAFGLGGGGGPPPGRIEAGAPADVVVLDYRSPTPLERIGGHWMFGLAAGHIRDVWVNGELVVAESRPTRVDQDKVAAEASAVAARLWERLQDVQPHPFQPAGSGG